MKNIKKFSNYNENHINDENIKSLESTITALNQCIDVIKEDITYFSNKDELHESQKDRIVSYCNDLTNNIYDFMKKIDSCH